MQSLAEWKNESANVYDEKKTACKPRTASAYGRAVKKQRVNLEPPRPMAARLITCGVANEKIGGHRGNTFFGARYSILLVSGTQQNYKMPATFSFRPESGRQ